MPNYAKATLVGHVTKDGEKVHDNVSKCGVCVNESYKKDEEWKSTPHFFDLVGFGAIADVMVDKMKKGACVLIECVPIYNRWEDKNGNKRNKVEFKVLKIVKLDKRDTTTEYDSGSSTGDDDDMGGVPF